MTTIESKRAELKKVNILLNRLTSMPLYKARALNNESKKLMLENLKGFEAQKGILLSEILTLQGL